MATWQFDVLPESLVEQELTQRDQFNNDDVGLSDALVREVIQNSTDASNGTPPVKVRFHVNSLEGDDASYLRSLFAGLRPHLDACQMDTSSLDQATIRVLTIEDFNTIGLTGAYDSLQSGHFRSFWRVHGRSGKGGSSGGRWGLGKLVYSSSSAVRSFFGLTIRQDSVGPLLLGQAVLSIHQLGQARYAAHGFWFDHRTSTGIQLPVMETDVVKRIRSVLGFSRVDQPGFSVALPWVQDSITEESLLSGIIKNYYFPLLSGQLVAEVGNRTVNKEKFHEVATTALTSSDGVPLPFVEAVSARLGLPPDAVVNASIGIDGLDKSALHPQDLEKIKERYRQGLLVHVRVPVRLRPKQGPDSISAVDLFLSQPPEDAKPFALFVRGPITLVGERRYFGGMPAHAALIAAEDAISEFLGDAENPAHTAWNANAEKLTKNWRSPARTLRNVRYSLRQLYDVVAERIDRTDRDALIDFFSLADQARPSEKPKRRTIAIPPSLPARQKAILIKPRQGGFAIAAGPGAAGWTFPRTIRIRVAYDIVGGDPFKRHSSFDFDLSKGEIQMSREHAVAEVTGSNIVVLKAESAEFGLEVSGFDEKRDLVVSARVSQ